VCCYVFCLAWCSKWCISTWSQSIVVWDAIMFQTVKYLPHRIHSDICIHSIYVPKHFDIFSRSSLITCVLMYLCLLDVANKYINMITRFSGLRRNTIYNNELSPAQNSQRFLCTYNPTTRTFGYFLKIINNNMCRYLFCFCLIEHMIAINMITKFSGLRRNAIYNSEISSAQNSQPFLWTHISNTRTFWKCLKIICNIICRYVFYLCLI
jgi:hypothetical protein